jgi:hypothetical protein
MKDSVQIYAHTFHGLLNKMWRIWSGGSIDILVAWKKKNHHPSVVCQMLMQYRGSLHRLCRWEKIFLAYNLLLCVYGYPMSRWEYRKYSFPSWTWEKGQSGYSRSMNGRPNSAHMFLQQAHQCHHVTGLWKQKCINMFYQHSFQCRNVKTAVSLIIQLCRKVFLFANLTSEAVSSYAPLKPIIITGA